MIAAETGSGKTLTYLLPIVNELLSGTSRHLPRAIIVVPSRELCFQVRDVLAQLTDAVVVRTAVGSEQFPAPFHVVTDILVTNPACLLLNLTDELVGARQRTRADRTWRLWW